MDMSRITEKMQEALHLAQSEASRRSNQQIDLEHLLAALLAQEGGLAASILKRAGVDISVLSARLNEELDRLPRVTVSAGAPDQIYVTQRLNKVFNAAEDKAKQPKDDFVS